MFRMDQDWSGCEEAFQLAECCFGFLKPLVRDGGGNELGELCGYAPVVSNEIPVEVGESQRVLQFLVVKGVGPSAIVLIFSGLDMTHVFLGSLGKD